MPKSHYQSTSLFMAYDEFCIFVNKMHDLIGFGINSNSPLVSASLVDTRMPW